MKRDSGENPVFRFRGVVHTWGRKGTSKRLTHGIAPFPRQTHWPSRGIAAAHGIHIGRAVALIP